MENKTDPIFRFYVTYTVHEMKTIFYKYEINKPSKF